MIETTMEMLGKGYPHQLKHEDTWKLAFEIHKKACEEGGHTGDPDIINPIMNTSGGNYCDCYARAWFETVGLELELSRYDPNDYPFEPRV